MGCVAAAIRLAVASAAIAAAQPASVAGTVTDSTSYKPLERVHVTLLRDVNSSTIHAPYGAMSDSAGYFSIAGIDPGPYKIELERAGYIEDAGNPSLNLKPGQQAADVSVKMAQAAMLNGRVTDSNGDPVMRIDVDLMPVPPTRIPRSVEWAGYAATNDRGEFHLLVGPGKYRLEAHPERYGPRGIREVRTDGSSEGFYGPTFFPSASTESAAGVVEVSAGRDVAGLDIRLTAPGPQRPLSISGTVTGLPADFVARLILWRTAGWEPPFFALIGADGKFTIGGLRPGPYELTALSEGRYGRMSVTLDTSDVGNLTVTLNEPVEVTGTVEPTGKWTVRLQRVARGPLFGSSPTGGEVGADGAFRIAGVTEGSFRVGVDPLPDNAYIRKMEANGEEVADETIQVTPASAPRVKVTLGLDGAILSGRILDADGDPEGRGYVALMTGAKSGHRTAYLEDGKYTFTGVRPGKYRLVAQTDTGEASETQFDAAEEIEIKPGDRIVKDVKVSDGKKQ